MLAFLVLIFCAVILGTAFGNYAITVLMIIAPIVLAIPLSIYLYIIRPRRILKKIAEAEFLGDFPVYKSEPVSTGFGIGYSDEPFVVHNFEYQDVVKGYVGHFKCTMKNGKTEYYKVKYNSWLYKKLK